MAPSTTHRNRQKTAWVHYSLVPSVHKETGRKQHESIIAWYHQYTQKQAENSMDLLHHGPSIHTERGRQTACIYYSIVHLRSQKWTENSIDLIQHATTNTHRNWLTTATLVLMSWYISIKTWTLSFACQNCRLSVTYNMNAKEDEQGYGTAMLDV